MVKHYVGMAVDSTKILDLDRLGMNCSVMRKGQTFKVRGRRLGLGLTGWLACALERRVFAGGHSLPA